MSVFKRPFLDVLAELRRGKVNAELTDKLHDLIAQCRDTGKKGQITLTLSVDPEKDYDDGRAPMVKVTDQIVVKTPRRDTKPSLFYVSDEGNFTRTDPNQEAFSGLREVDNPDTQQADKARKQATR